MHASNRANAWVLNTKSPFIGCSLRTTTADAVFFFTTRLFGFGFLDDLPLALPPSCPFALNSMTGRSLGSAILR